MGTLEAYKLFQAGHRIVVVINSCDGTSARIGIGNKAWLLRVSKLPNNTNYIDLDADPSTKIKLEVNHVTF